MRSQRTISALLVEVQLGWLSWLIVFATTDLFKIDIFYTNFFNESRIFINIYNTSTHDAARAMHCLHVSAGRGE